MDDLEALYAPEPTAAPKAKPRAPKAAVPSAGLPEDQFKAILEDPSTLPSISKSGMNPTQQEAFRTAWPMTNQPSRPEGQDKAASLNGTLDRLDEYGTRVFSAPKVDKRAREAVQSYYQWLRDEQKSETGEGAGTRKLIDAILPTKHDPISALKGPARQQASDMRDLIDHLKHAGTKEDELHILTAMLPDPSDKPEQVAAKRRAFANQVEELAQGMPPQFWRAAAKHIVRARRLRGPAEAPAPAAGAKAPPGAAPAAPGAEDTDPAAGFVKRALVGGATGLALPTIAAVRTALGETEAEHQQGQAMMMPPGMAEAVGAPPVPTLTAAQRGKSFGENAAELRDTRAQNLGFPTGAALAEQEETDKAEHPVAARLAGFAGGMADPTNVLLGLPARAVEGLSPVVRTAIAHALPGATAGGLSAAGAGADTGGILKGAGLGAVIGTALGKGAEHLLGAPGRNAAIAKTAAEEGAALKMTPGEIATRKAELEADVFANKEATKAALGSKTAQHELGPKLELWKRQLLEKHGIEPGSKLATSLNALEDAIESGDVKAAATERAAWDKAWAASPNFSKSSEALKKDIDALLNIRAVKVAAEHSGGHGNVSNYGANVHPNATLANPEVSSAAFGQAAIHHAAVAGPAGLPMIGIAAARRGVGTVTRPVEEALARLYLARQQGDINAVQGLAEQALRSGAPLSLVTQIVGSLGGGGEQ